MTFNPALAVDRKAAMHGLTLMFIRTLSPADLTRLISGLEWRRDQLTAGKAAPADPYGVYTEFMARAAVYMAAPDQADS
jgi:hypothetical protein